MPASCDYRLAEEVVAITYNFDDYSCYALGDNFDNNFLKKFFMLNPYKKANLIK